VIQIKDNIIPKAKLTECNLFLDKSNWSYGWQSNKDVPYGHWNVDITKTLPNNPTDVAIRLPKSFKELWDSINKEIFKDQAKLTRCYSNRQTFGTEGYIHLDSRRESDQTVIVYMNENWEADWGGETSFYNKDKTEITKSIMPHYGRVVVFPGTMYHCARAVSRICPKARTTLMFKVTIDPKALYDSETLLTSFLHEIGADKLPHKSGTLFDHLIRTFHIIKTIGMNDILALAGGLHSVYSTNYYKTACLPFTSEKILETFGPEIDRIVRLFCTIDKPQALENPDGTLSEVDLFLLRCIECANLYDQQALDPEKYPNLYNFVLALRNNKG